MTNPNDAIGTNAAYGTRTSVNAFNDICQFANGRGILSGWAVVPKSGMTVSVGGVAGTRDVAIAEDNLGNRTTINNRSSLPVDITISAASATANRYDAIVAYVNNPPQATAATPIPQDAPSVCGIIAVEGGTTSITEAQIRTAITADGATGSTAYYVILATVFVGTGTTTITGANITQTHASLSAADIADAEITRRMIDWSTIKTTLYTGGTPSTTTYALNDAINNYDYLIITFTSGASDAVQRPVMWYESGRITDGFYFSQIALYGGTVYNQNARFTINTAGTSISRAECKQVSNFDMGDTSTGNYISIRKIEGIKLS